MCFVPWSRMYSYRIHATQCTYNWKQKTERWYSDYSKQQQPHFFLLLKIYMDDLLYKYCLGVNIYKETTYQWEIIINILEISIFIYTCIPETTNPYVFICHTSLLFAIKVYLRLFFYIHYNYLHWTPYFPNKICILKCLLKSTWGQLTHL